MLGCPGIPTTELTRPPPAAGPRFRNFRFANGSLSLAESESDAICAAARVQSAKLRKRTKIRRNDEWRSMIPPGGNKSRVAGARKRKRIPPENLCRNTLENHSSH